MAIQRITIAKIAGPGGQLIQERVRAWAALEAQADDNEDLRPSLIRQVTAFVNAFRANASEPPVLFFAEYIDQWSVAFSQVRFFPKKCPITLVLNAGPSVATYELPDAGKLRRHISRKLKRPKSIWAYEDRWFLSHLHDAIVMYSAILPRATLIILRESWTSSPDDTEVIASASTIPPWLATSLGR
jgi:hypothetical protein